MRTNFHHHLLMQIEMLRGGISHEELSKRLGEKPYMMGGCSVTLEHCAASVDRGQESS